MRLDPSIYYVADRCESFAQSESSLVSCSSFEQDVVFCVQLTSLFRSSSQALGQVSGNQYTNTNNFTLGAWLALVL